VYVREGVCACVRACVRVCVGVCERGCVCERDRGWMCVGGLVLHVN